MAPTNGEERGLLDGPWHFMPAGHGTEATFFHEVRRQDHTVDGMAVLVCRGWRGAETAGTHANRYYKIKLRVKVKAGKGRIGYLLQRCGNAFKNGVTTSIFGSKFTGGQNRP